MSDLFNVPNDDTSDSDVEDVNYLEAYVGPGKKYASTEDLAKSYKNAEDFINQLKNETAGLRTELDSRLALEELVTKLSSQANMTNTAASNQNATNSYGERPEENTNPALSRDELMSLVRSTINEERTSARMDENRKLVQGELKKAWGPNFVENLRNVQRTMGVDDATLDHLAKTSPQLFLNAVLGSSRTSVDPNTNVPVRTQVNSQASVMRSTSSAEREFQELTKLRSSNPSLYWSPATQNKLLKLTEQRMKESGEL